MKHIVSAATVARRERAGTDAIWNRWSAPVDRFTGYVGKAEGDACWEWTGAVRKTTGYGLFCLNQKQLGAHRASWEFFVGAIPEGLCVLHRCDNRKCVRPDHLFLGTIDDNNKDMTKKRRHWAHSRPEIALRGVAHGRARWTEDDIRRMRAMYAAGAPLLEIAKAMGTHKASVHKIVTRQAWKHVA